MRTMRTGSLKYAWLTLKHKWFVIVAGVRLRVPLRRLLLHDLSKFGFYEIGHYGRQFFGDHNDPLGFSYAWLHHQKYNLHHWEAWIPVSGHTRGGYPGGEPLPMPLMYVREMVADWFAASRTYEGKWPEPGKWKWFGEHYCKIKVHKDTRRVLDTLLDRFLDEYGYPLEWSKKQNENGCHLVQSTGLAGLLQPF